ncbi:MAG: hypothetical protein G01um101430_283 [Parcubacteria group bacterium Gr01-1014_30]|nr:MAG: hypothetical protein G01um101430_283 [Parcubacteria group bacterium Gr01-1014_30]
MSLDTTKANNISLFLAAAILISSVFGFLGGILADEYFDVPQYLGDKTLYAPATSQEQAIIETVNSASKSVVSIIITKDLPVFEEFYVDPFKEFEEFFGPSPFPFRVPQRQQKGIEKREVGGGTGFVTDPDGTILTNAHVVADEEADYTVLTNDGKRYEAEVLARDTFRDLAVIKIKDDGELPALKLGDSDNLQIGQTVVAIGNALGEFRNTVSVGVISGLGRQVTAGGGDTVVTLEDVIQTDAAINRGNSGGPLLNLRGEVIGVNFAIAEPAQNIGFAIPVNKAKKTIEQVKTLGRIAYPFLGVRYILLQEGVLIQKGDSGEAAIFPGSAAERAGLREGDIILEFNGEKITSQNTLAKLIMEHNPGDKVTLKISRNGQEFSVDVVLGERP